MIIINKLVQDFRHVDVGALRLVAVESQGTVAFSLGAMYNIIHSIIASSSMENEALNYSCQITHSDAVQDLLFDVVATL